MGGQAQPAKGDGNNRWVLAIAEHGDVVVQGGRNTLQGRVGDTILVAPDSELAEITVEIGTKLVGGDLVKVLGEWLDSDEGPADVRQTPQESARSILYKIAEELGFDVPAVRAIAADPLQMALTIAAMPSSYVRWRRSPDGEFATFNGPGFLDLHRELRESDESITIEIERAWIQGEE
jgi:hypothetical protein